MTDQSRGPLAGIRVIDFSIQAAGPWAGALLGMLGAEVIKVERPTGHGTRFALPRQRGMGTNYISMNVNKKNVILDLKKEDARATAMRLAGTCDILIENLRVGVMARLGLGYRAISAVNPKLVYCSVSGFGEHGPLAKEGCGDAVMQAFSGFARCNGAYGEKVEAFRFTGLLDLATAAAATSAILAALLEREATGLGQKVAVSMLEAALEFECTRIADLLHAHVTPVPRGSESFGLVPDRAFSTLDREIFVTAHNDAEWGAFCKALEKPDLAHDALFLTNPARVAHRDQLHAIVEPIIKARPAIWWMRAFERHDVPAGLAHHFETFRHHVQVAANEMIACLNTRDWGDVSVAGVPWHFSATPCVVREPARPGEHTEEIVAQLKENSQQPCVIPDQSATLAGLRVVEFAEGIAGPLTGLRLSELGADVVKLEPPEGDWLRNVEPLLQKDNVSAAFYELNRGKRSLALGADTVCASRLILSLLKHADVLITDRRASELKALGIDDGDAAAIAGNPQLIVVFISPWGRKGPYAEKKGSELTAQAMSGYTRYLGSYGRPSLRLGADVASSGTGMFALQAVLAALYARERIHRGQRVDLSMLNSLLAMKSVHLAAQSDPDEYDGPRVGGANHAPMRGWQTADQPIFLKFGGSIGTEGREGWVDFMKEIGLEHYLSDPRCDRAGRETTGNGRYVREFRPIYEKAFARYSATQLCSMIVRHGGDVATYIGADETLAHAQTQSLGVIQSVIAGDGTPGKIRAFPAHFSSLQTRSSAAVPSLGQHNEAILAELGRDEK